ncbi:fatty acyl-CoA reductase 1-like isoform X5 [Adelges cooleyi]|uniref:fatty acyl-CoA reductase 1-like isoform X5 n=1 Tax=Adelges cooleyi TaxID=133065 RepID=UPI0021800DB9|nr:fatty acyl-CoA reductase 1-like isoform X5 [Adelges cooleyi]
MSSNIVDVYNGGTILITGSTGFLGKLLTEKLLRSSKGIKNIAIIVRDKNGLSAKQRAANMYEEKIFDRLRKERPDFTNYIKVIDGDLTSPSLSLSTVNHEWLLKNVNFIFHCAATVKFNEPIKNATKTNIEGSENLIDIALQMKALKGFVHVSTAYSHYPRTEIEELFYPTPITASELKQKLNLDGQPYKIPKGWPNTYTFTKAITENLILTYAKRLPIAVFRPSIVGCTYMDPSSGHLENMNGPSGGYTAIVCGFLRAVPCKMDKIADIIPADYVVNTLIAVMWDTVNGYYNNSSYREKPKIFNCVSSAESPLTWRNFDTGILNSYKVAPPMSSMWYYGIMTYSNSLYGILLNVLLHKIPAILLDFIRILIGKKTKFWKMYVNADKTMNLLGPFTTKEWKFTNNNTRVLWSSMSQKDQQLFPFSMNNFDWNQYINVFYHGIRKNNLHEETDNICMALKKNRKLYWIKQFLVYSLIYVVLSIFWKHLFVSSREP